MSFLSKLPFFAPSSSVSALEAELAELNATGAALLSETQQRRADLHELDDASAIIHANAAIQATENRLRKVESKIGDVRDKLTAARQTARIKQHAELRVTYATELSKFLTQAEKLLEQLPGVHAAREALFLAGFGIEHEAAPPLPLIGTALAIDGEIIARLRGDLARFSAPDNFAAPELYRDPALAQAAVAAHSASAETEAMRSGRRRKAEQAAPRATERPSSVRLNELPSPPSPAPRAPFDEIAGEGEQLVTVLRNGLEIQSKGQLRAGDRVAVPAQQAEVLMKNGAVEPAWRAADGKGDPVTSVAES